jgi:hypothetical protein
MFHYLDGDAKELIAKELTEMLKIQQYYCRITLERISDINDY